MPEVVKSLADIRRLPDVGAFFTVRRL